MKRLFNELYRFLAAVAAIGAMAVAWLVVTQVVALAVAVGVALVAALIADWITGVVAGIFAYAAVMKLLHYLDIFEMITSNKKRRGGRIDQEPPRPVDVPPAEPQPRQTE